MQEFTDSHSEHNNLVLEKRMFLVILLAIVISSLCVYVVTRHLFHQAALQRFQTQALGVAEYAEAQLDKSGFQQITSPEDEKGALYRASQLQLNNLRKLARVSYLYLATFNDKGEVIYLVDGLPSGTSDFRHVGDPVEPQVSPIIKESLNEEKTRYSDNITSAGGGSIFLVCSPVRAGNKVAGVLVMEFSTDDLASYNLQASLLSFAIALSVCLGVFFLTRLMLRKVSLSFYKRLAYTDYLSGLNNRNAFELDIKHYGRSAKIGQESITLVVYDLNCLKQVNDTKGHPAGDKYIKKMALIMNSFRPGGKVVNYRIGGDEFVSTFFNTPESEVLELVAHSFKQSRQGGPDSDFFEFSYGIATFSPVKDDSLRAAFVRADLAMYSFKEEIKQQEPPKPSSLPSQGLPHQ